MVIVVVEIRPMHIRHGRTCYTCLHLVRCSCHHRICALADGWRNRGEDVMDRQAYWNRIYDTTPSTELSWHQAEPTLSLRLIDAAGFTPSS